MLALAKSVILGPSLALLGSKYKRPSGEENKNPNNVKVTVLKQVGKNFLPGKFSENRFFLSCTGKGDRYSKSLLKSEANNAISISSQILQRKVSKVAFVTKDISPILHTDDLHGTGI